MVSGRTGDVDVGFDAAAAFLDVSDFSLNFRYVFVLGADVDCDSV